MTPLGILLLSLWPTACTSHTTECVPAMENKDTEEARREEPDPAVAQKVLQGSLVLWLGNLQIGLHIRVQSQGVCCTELLACELLDWIMRVLFVLMFDVILAQKYLV